MESVNSDITAIRNLLETQNIRTNTALSSYLWDLKKKSEISKLQWSILKIVRGYSNILKRCLFMQTRRRHFKSGEN